jgi:hypothetical protein
MRRRGEFNPVNWILGLGFLAGGYYLYFVGPLWFERFDVQDVIGVAMNRHTNSPQGVVEEVVSGLNDPRFGSVTIQDEEGNPVVKPGLDVLSEDITVEGDEVSGVRKVTVRYQKVVRWLPTSRKSVMKFTVERSRVQ